MTSKLVSGTTEHVAVPFNDTGKLERMRFWGTSNKGIALFMLYVRCQSDTQVNLVSKQWNLHTSVGFGESLEQRI